jgi:membrane associated rhomboid family serine protease
VFPIRDNAPTRRFPIVTVGLIVANVLVFLWEYSGGGLNRHVFQYGYYPCRVEAPCTQPYTLLVHHPAWPETVFTSMFMHGGIVHIAGNMLFLWIFGNNVEDVMGRARFLLWYLACGIAATAVQTYVTLQFANAHDASIPNVGASGAIAGVLGAYFLILPRASVLTAITLGFFFIFREIPAIWFLGIWFAFQLIEGGFSVTHPQAGGGVAFFAHIGGFVFGLATVYLVAKRRPLAPKPRFRW